MAMALLVALLLPHAQDDPQVTYREGLFEEVDQGNLDKATELYAKVLKSGAPDTLKAKALLRTGFCHEKRGKRKEAEQAWRDVIERYPSAASAKIAQERLASSEGAAPVSIDVQVQSAILDLGAVEEPQRGLAIRKLVLIGEPALSDVTRALQHRDRALSLGAARVMIEWDRWEPAYEVYKRHFPNIPLYDSISLAQILKKHEGARNRFVSDAQQMLDGPLIGMIAQTLVKLEDPAFKVLVEHWMATPQNEGYFETAFMYWKQATGDEELGRFINRLASLKEAGYSKLQKIMPRVASEPVGPATRKAVLKALENHPDLPRLFNLDAREGQHYWFFFKVVDTEELFAGPVLKWLDSPDDEFRKQALGVLLRSQESFREPDKARGRLFDLLASPKLPLKVREVGINTPPWDPKGGMQGMQPFLAQYLTLCLHYLRAHPPSDVGSVQLSDTALRSLISYSTVETPDLPEILDLAFSTSSRTPEPRIPPRIMKEAPDKVIAAAIRALQRASEGSPIALSVLREHGSPEQLMGLGALIPGWKDEVLPLSSNLAGSYVAGLARMPKERQEAAWGEFETVFNKSPEDMKIQLAACAAGVDHPRVDAFMKKVLDSPLEALRISAIRHWRARESSDSVAPLIRSLSDSSESNQATAMEALGHLRALDAVPELIKFLESSNTSLRDSASGALKLIRDHYEERTQWKRWYDETKKALNK